MRAAVSDDVLPSLPAETSVSGAFRPLTDGPTERLFLCVSLIVRSLPAALSLNDSATMDLYHGCKTSTNPSGGFVQCTLAHFV